AWAMAWRISSVGWVTVSERRATIPPKGYPLDAPNELRLVLLLPGPRHPARPGVHPDARAARARPAARLYRSMVPSTPPPPPRPAHDRRGNGDHPEGLDRRDIQLRGAVLAHPRNDAPSAAVPETASAYPHGGHAQANRGEGGRQGLASGAAFHAGVGAARRPP